MQSQYIAGVDIGGTKMAVIIATIDSLLVRITEPTVKTGTVRALGEQVLSMLDRACQHAGIQPSQIGSVGIGSCGPFVKLDGWIGLSAPNICGGLSARSDLNNDWTEIPLEQLIRERFDHVVIANDCVAALAAERAFGAVRNEPNCAYVTWSTGVGCGLCVDGRLLFGKHGNAGHAGHMLMDVQSNAVCGCGNRGDWEALVSGRNLDYASPLDTPHLFDAARRGEMPARQEVEQAAQWFGRALYNLVAVLDIRTFVIGGAIWTHHGNWLLPLVRTEFESRFKALTNDVTIVPASLGPLVADIGALSLVMPEAWLAQWCKEKPWHSLKK